MLEMLIYASPDIVLLLGAASIFVLQYFRKENPKLYFLLTKIFLAIALFLSLVFYNKIFAPSYLSENSYTTMIKVVLYLLTIAWYYVSFKWFAGKNLSGGLYCALGLILTEAMCILVSAINLISFFIGISVLILMEKLLVKKHLILNKKSAEENIFAWIIIFIALLGIFWIYNTTGSFSYSDIKAYLNINGTDMKLGVAFCSIIISLFYVLMLFPLSFDGLIAGEKTILPISGYLAVIPPLAAFSGLFIVFHLMIMPIYEVFRPALVGISLLSMFYGAFGAKKETNLRLLFSYSSIYHFGVVLLIISYMESYAVLSAFVYFIIYILAAFGIYTSMYAFKSRGEYISKVDDIAGVYQPLPYIAASVMILVLSMLGTPPLLGFLGRFYITNQLFIENDYTLVILVLLPLGVLVSAYLKIIKTMYFEPRVKNFDRVDKGIYISLFVNIMLVMITLFNTYEIVKIARDIIYKMF